MSTQTIERPLADTSTNEDGSADASDEAPRYFHYVKKNKIVESAVTGTFVIALCGEIFPVTQVPKPDSTVCPKCKEIFDSLHK